MSNHAAHIIRIDGFGNLLRWEVKSARVVTIAGQSFWNLRVQPVARVTEDGSDVPTVHLSRGRTITAEVTGPVETLNLPL
jgi:hypothetical protein